MASNIYWMSDFLWMISVKLYFTVGMRFLVDDENDVNKTFWSLGYGSNGYHKALRLPKCFFGFVVENTIRVESLRVLWLGDEYLEDDRFVL